MGKTRRQKIQKMLQMSHTLRSIWQRIFVSAGTDCWGQPGRCCTPTELHWSVRVWRLEDTEEIGSQALKASQRSWNEIVLRVEKTPRKSCLQETDNPWPYFIGSLCLLGLLINICRLTHGRCPCTALESCKSSGESVYISPELQAARNQSGGSLWRYLKRQEGIWWLK